MMKVHTKIIKAALAATFVFLFLYHPYTIGIEQNTVLAAQVKEYKINYDLDGGENSQTNPDSYQAGIGVTSFAEPYKFEHNFEGWYSDAALQNKVTSIDADTSGNVTLYAKWSMYDYDYNIYYNTNYGYNGEHNPSGYYEGVGVHILEDAKRRGYTFEGWYLKDVNMPYTKKVESISETASGDISIEAKFTPNTYQITYNLMGGEFAEEGITSYVFGNTYTEFPKPALETKRFDGWYLDKDCTRKFAGIDKETLGDLTLYAKWREAVAEEVILDVTELTLMEGQEADISVIGILPEDALDKTIVFESGDETIATVDENGHIQGIAPGQTEIYARVHETAAVCKVTVEALPTPTPTPTNTPTPTPTPTPRVYQVAFFTSKYSVKTTKTVNTKVKLEAGDQVKSYQSSNTKVAKVDKNGVVKGISVGTAQITVTTTHGAKAVCTVTVSKNIVKTKKLTLSNVKNGKLTLKKGKTFRIKAVITPKDSTEGLKYTTSKKSIATVSTKGLIKGKKKGNCIITVKSGSKSKKIMLTVK
ncbi:MAG: InlB B-repeat-containing protein [Lachnospiraceae bacterium]|nr:InlB B-repeat-containing protein [Lachnospiraceae bacterium]